MAWFEYEPIDLSQPAIRLARLLKGNDSKIRCEIFQAFFNRPDSLIEYEALSYTWGGTNMTDHIMIGDEKIEVTENLYLALQYLRYENEDRVLWIDGLCINQGDHKEKGHQVQQMSNIYSRAQQVIIWLGDPTKETDVFMESMKELDTESIKYSRNNWKISDPAWRDIWSTVQRKLRGCHTDLEAQQRDGLESLLWRPWFSRVWILQEVANARAAIIMCGSRYFSARLLALAPRLIEVEPDPHCKSVLDIMPGRSREDSWWSQKRDFRTILEKFGTSKASDPRDNIYALLGLSSDACGSDLRADYEKSLEAVFRDTTAFLLKLPELRRTEYAPNCNMPHFLRHLNDLKNEVLLWAQEAKQVDIARKLLCREDFNMSSQAQIEMASLLMALRTANRHLPWTSVTCDNPERIIERLLSCNHVDWNSKDENGVAPLLRAVQAEDTISAILLLKRPEIVLNCEDFYGNTPLSVAIGNGKTELIQLLAEWDDLDINFEAKTCVTPLLKAIDGGQDDIMKLVLSYPKVNVNHMTKDGKTPLLTAVQKGYKRAAELLTGHQDINLNLQNREGLTPLLSAVQLREEETGKEIGKLMVGILLNHHDIDVNMGDKHGMTPLSRAIQKRDQWVVEQLLESPGILINAPDNEGKTPLHLALHMAMGRGVYYYCAAELLKRPEILVNVSDNEGKTPLHIAMGSHDDSHNWSATLLLTRPEILVNVPDNEGRTPLHIALQNKDKGLVRLLLGRPEFEIYVLDKDSASCLYIATGIERWRAFDLLLENLKNVVIGETKDGKTTVIISRDEASGKMANLLLEIPGVMGDLETLPSWARGLWEQENAKLQKSPGERIEVETYPTEKIMIDTPPQEKVGLRTPRGRKRLLQCTVM